MTWDELLKFLSEEIELRDQVTKFEVNSPSIVEVKFGSSQIRTKELIGYVKQKESNIMKKIKVLNLFG